MWQRPVEDVAQRYEQHTPTRVLLLLFPRFMNFDILSLSGPPGTFVDPPDELVLVLLVPVGTVDTKLSITGTPVFCLSVLS